MYLGLSYILKRNAKSRLENNDGSFIFSGATNYYFTNPMVAFRVKHHLDKVHKDYKYRIQEIPEEILNKKIYIKSYKDFLAYINTTQEQTSQIEMDK